MPKLTPEEIEKRFVCTGCGVHTGDKHEYYMLNDDVWFAANAGVREGMKCIGCVEKALGRRLTPADFSPAPINLPAFSRKSRRLKNRLGIEPVKKDTDEHPDCVEANRP